MKQLFLLFVTLFLMSCNGRNSEIRDAVDAVNKTTPTKSWDSEKFESVAFDAEDNVVIFEIANVYPDAQMNDSADNQRKTGIWYISNFMTAYGYVKDGSDDCEGDAEMFRAVGSLLKLMVENEVGARFKFYFSEGGSFSCDLSPKDVKKAVRMRKEDYYDEFGSRSEIVREEIPVNTQPAKTSGEEEYFGPVTVDPFQWEGE